MHIRTFNPAPRLHIITQTEKEQGAVPLSNAQWGNRGYQLPGAVRALSCKGNKQRPEFPLIFTGAQHLYGSQAGQCPYGAASKNLI